jgi:hypothetical protein
MEIHSYTERYWSAQQQVCSIWIGSKMQRSCERGGVEKLLPKKSKVAITTLLEWHAELL